MKTRYVKSKAAGKQSVNKQPAKTAFDGENAHKEQLSEMQAPEECPTEEKVRKKKRFFKKQTPKVQAPNEQPSEKKPRKNWFSKNKVPKTQTPNGQPSEKKPRKKWFFKKQLPKENPAKTRSLKLVLMLIPCMALVIGLALAAISMMNRHSYPSPSYSYTPPVVEQTKEEDKMEEPPQEQERPEEIELPLETDDSSQDSLDNQNETEPPIDKAAIQEELDILSENRPKMLIDCTYCDGSGNSSTFCERCEGSGVITLSGTIFMTPLDCPKCRGSKYQPCSHCTFGLMNNPDFETEIADWHDKRHTLWRALGYTEAEIAYMEEQEAKNALENMEDSNIEIPLVPEENPSISNGGGRICQACHTTGKCSICKGARQYLNPFTGEFIQCKSCTDGSCTICGGDGYI